MQFGVWGLILGNALKVAMGLYSPFGKVYRTSVDRRMQRKCFPKRNNKLEKTALDRGPTDYISLTHDLDFDFETIMVSATDLGLQSPARNYGHIGPTHLQKFKVNGLSVSKISGNERTGGRSRLHYLPR